MFNEIKTKRGRLSAYGFFCGYVETKANGPIVTTLWAEGTYHVRQYNHATGQRVFWEVFDKLKEARSFFDKQAGKRES